MAFTQFSLEDFVLRLILQEAERSILLSDQPFKFFKMCTAMQLEPWAELPVLWHKVLKTALQPTSLFSVCFCLHTQWRTHCHTHRRGVNCCYHIYSVHDWNCNCANTRTLPSNVTQAWWLELKVSMCNQEYVSRWGRAWACIHLPSPTDPLKLRTAKF